MKNRIKYIIANTFLLILIAHSAHALTWSSLDGKIKDTLESLKLGRHSIESDYHSGVLVVTGYVGTEDEKRRVVESLGRLEGITSVEDHLEVKGGVGVSSAADEPIRKAALEVVKGLTGLGSYEVDIQGEDGKLILTGSVSSAKDKTRIEDAVKLAVGHHPLESRIVLAPPLSDAQIEKNVWDALNKEKDLDTEGIAIAVNNGVVTISGNRPNHRLIDRILSIANMADGIREIKSQMKIKKQ